MIKEEKALEIVDKKGIMSLTLKECQEDGLTMGMIKLGNVSFDMPWDVAIKVVNRLAKRPVISWSSTFEEAIEMMGTFL